MNKHKRVKPLDWWELSTSTKYFLTREGQMKDHTGVYVFKDVFNTGVPVLYNEELRVHYTIPLTHSDIKLYKIIDEEI